MVAAYHEGEIWSDMAFRRPHYESRQSVVEIRLQKPSIPNSKSDIHLHLPLYVVMHIVVTVQPSIDNIILWVSARGRSSRVVTYRIIVSYFYDTLIFLSIRKNLLTSPLTEFSMV